MNFQTIFKKRPKKGRKKWGPGRILSAQEGEQDPEYFVEELLEKRPIKNTWEYHVKWCGYQEPTWEPLECLQNCQELLAEFEVKQREKENSNRRDTVREVWLKRYPEKSLPSSSSPVPVLEDIEMLPSASSSSSLPEMLPPPTSSPPVQQLKKKKKKLRCPVCRKKRRSPHRKNLYAHLKYKHKDHPFKLVKMKGRRAKVIEFINQIIKV